MGLRWGDGEGEDIFASCGRLCRIWGFGFDTGEELWCCSDWCLRWRGGGRFLVD